MVRVYVSMNALAPGLTGQREARRVQHKGQGDRVTGLVHITRDEIRDCRSRPQGLNRTDMRKCRNMLRKHDLRILIS